MLEEIGKIAKRWSLDRKRLVAGDLMIDHKASKRASFVTVKMTENLHCFRLVPSVLLNTDL